MKNKRVLTKLLLALTFVIIITNGFSYAQYLQRPVNLDFEGSQFDMGRGRGWTMSKGLTNFKVNLSIRDPHSGKYSAEISSIGYSSMECGSISQSINAIPYRGKEITIKAFVRANVRSDGWSSLFLRTRRSGDLFLYNQKDDIRITESKWKEYSITKMVEDDAETIEFGCALFREGTVSLDDLTFIGDDGGLIFEYEGPRPLSDRGLENLMVFGKLFGYIRYFHPSDQAARAIWDNIAINGVRDMESASSDSDLVARLLTIFSPLAPTLQISIGNSSSKDTQTNIPSEATHVMVWKHKGVGMGSQPQIYSSKREKFSLSKVSKRTDDNLSKIYSSGRVVQKQLSSNIFATIPLMVFATESNTLPIIQPLERRDALPAGYTPNGNDRATRLADVIILWNVFQHFYPYFDVVKTDWGKAFTVALIQAASAENSDSFELTLRELTAQLHDGHASAWHNENWQGMRYAPVGIYVEGNTVVITDILDEAKTVLRRGDIIEKINDEDIGMYYDKRRKLISTSTPQHKDYMLSRSTLGVYSKDSVKLTIRSTGEASRSAYVKTTKKHPTFRSNRPKNISELQKGIYYVNLDKVTPDEFKYAMDSLVKANAVIFDMRGYPIDISFIPIEHMIDEPVSSARWNIPLIRYPDREFVEWDTSSWSIKPKSPQLPKNIVHLIDGRAVSRAETYMGIIEYYKIGEIVGSPTAGTNGNINPFTLPGNYEVSWTGMKVLKHDGSQHHGVGIKPTVYCKPTVEGIRDGRDEILEKGIEVAKKMIEKNR